MNPLIKENLDVEAKPFLKWAGGKTQLLDDIAARLPAQIVETGVIDNYIEPFIGGGAVFFFLKSNFQINKACLYDTNRDLVLAYNVIKNHPQELVDNLYELENNYLEMNNNARKAYYYEIRNEYNGQLNEIDYDKYNNETIKRTAYLIFLNKTCFNGLYRVNSKGEFNVPSGRYKNPKICDRKNIKEVHKALKNTEIICADFMQSSKCIDENTFVYMDPPYRPLNCTASFTSYCKERFAENDQIRLANFFRTLDKEGALLMLSNSDPKNENPNDLFFDDLYEGYNIERVLAKRFINCDASKRGDIKEIIIRNYD